MIKMPHKSDPTHTHAHKEDDVKSVVLAAHRQEKRRSRPGDAAAYYSKGNLRMRDLRNRNWRRFNQNESKGISDFWFCEQRVLSQFVLTLSHD